MRVKKNYSSLALALKEQIHISKKCGKKLHAYKEGNFYRLSSMSPDEHLRAQIAASKKREINKKNFLDWMYRFKRNKKVYPPIFEAEIYFNAGETLIRDFSEECGLRIYDGRIMPGKNIKEIS